MSLKIFYSELSKGFPSPIYLIFSSDNFLLYECQALIKENQTASDPLNFSLHDLDPSEGSASVKEIIAELNTFPFFGQRKTVVLKNLLKNSKKDISKLAEYLLNPSDFTLLIMLCASEYRKLFDPETLKKTKIISLQSVNLPVWILEKAKRKGFEITPNAIEYLIGTAGEDLAALNSEIEKLSLLGIKTIDSDDIKEIVYGGAKFSAFDLAKALLKRDKKTAFRIYFYLEKNTDPLIILGALNWYYRSQYDKAEQREKAEYHYIFRLIHEADVAQKSSSGNAIEDFLIRMFRLDQKFLKQAP